MVVVAMASLNEQKKLHKGADPPSSMIWICDGIFVVDR
jgi:hypothetical protein